MATNTRVKTRRPTAHTRKGLAIIYQVLMDDFENAFERLFPGVSDEAIMNICDATDWLGQYIDDES